MVSPAAGRGAAGAAGGAPVLRLLPMGDRAVLAEVAGLAEATALREALARSVPRGVVDIVPAARTVLVQFDPGVLSVAAARAWIRAAHDEGGSASPGPAVVVELPIVYDGPDLDETARMLGMGAEALAARHAGAAWSVAFGGFAPGFAYLVAPDWPFDVPRLEAPRTRVPPGAVGLAGEFTGAYPRATPGGWRLIGTTGAVLFDPARERPALLAPGTRVTWRPGRARSAAAAPPVPLPERAAGGFEVLEPGLLATVQDLGRPGHAAVGVAVSGALDRAALRLGNRLVGNRETAAGIEITLGGFRARARSDQWIAITGAAPAVTIGGVAVDAQRALLWPAGTELRLGWAQHGARAYAAVRGGIRAPVVAGSRATDRLAGIGLPPLAAGDALEAGEDAAGPVPPVDVVPWSVPPDILEIELAEGPRADWFSPDALRLLFDASWRVGAEADRVGIRLEGPPIERLRGGELPSEPMVPGAIQVPPSGQPTVLLADGPVTGGYPVIAVVAAASLDAVGQARPGTLLRFRHARRAP